MGIRLHKPERTEEQLKALAASGSSGLSRQAGADLRQLRTAQLQREIAEQAK